MVHISTYMFPRLANIFERFYVIIPTPLHLPQGGVILLGNWDVFFLILEREEKTQTLESIIFSFHD